ncbi:hypothetical protein [uncultured Eubacterium sp.]|uniref:hypothetical protein n=1 Tax=uncultured Eubacterium sp. TaxID=165185 RepID=UPI0026737917|nr:hypothetical protein [uncultured Eubacterium sp.]
MKVKVLKEFIDIHTNELHKKDTFFEANKKRIKEIQQVDKELIEVVNKKENEDGDKTKDSKTE